MGESASQSRMMGQGSTSSLKGFALPAAVCLGLFTPLPAFCQSTIIGSGTINGQSVDLRSDGSWRYSDGKTSVCIGDMTLAKVCVAPEDWHRVPDPGDAQKFLALANDLGLTAYVSVWPTPKPQSEMTDKEKARDVIFNGMPRLAPDKYLQDLADIMAQKDGMKPSRMGHGALDIAGIPGKFVALTSSSGLSGTRAYAIAMNDEVTIVVATFEGSTLYTSDHKRLLASLITAIKLEDKK